MLHNQDFDHRETHGVSRAELDSPKVHPAAISRPHDGDRTVIVASGDMTRDAAQQAGGEIESLQAGEHPLLTLDLRGATALDPRIVHALMHAWERRDRGWGCIRLLGPPAAWHAFSTCSGSSGPSTSCGTKLPTMRRRSRCWSRQS